MPITKSAKKALRGSARKGAFNLRRKAVMRDATKDAKKLIADKKGVGTEEAIRKAYQAIDKAAKRGVIKKNTAARKKSRLMAMLKKVNGK